MPDTDRDRYGRCRISKRSQTLLWHFRIHNVPCINVPSPCGPRSSQEKAQPFEDNNLRQCRGLSCRMPHRPSDRLPHCSGCQSEGQKSDGR